MSQEVEEKMHKIRNKRDLSSLDLCSIDDVTPDDIDLICDVAKGFKEAGNKKYSLLKDTTIFNAFFENSTRTRSSFELAGKKLGSDVINISGDSSSVKKHETLLDTAEVLNSMRPEVIVTRSSKEGFPHLLRRHVNASVLNAGDGQNEHPTQALLDYFTIKEHFEDISGHTVLIVGDILHSRVARSQIKLFLKYKLKIRLAAPLTFIPRRIEELFPVKIYNNIEEALKGVDIVSTLRVQEERGAEGLIPTLREFSKTFGISKKRFALANKGAILMHPGPLMRDVEVHHALVASSRSTYFRQVENGLAVRSALLWLFARREDGKNKQINLI